ncbi:MAG: pyridoxal 5'-phosphate synthase glutaminase subunit PdxT [Actinomycetota bacterium]
MGSATGVLALQGDFEAHRRILAGLGADAREVRTPADLESVERLVVPGGESTTMRLLARNNDLIDPLRKRAEAGMPVFGTCAGLIVCAKRILDGDPPVVPIVDIAIRRNAYGRQVDSFEADVDVRGIGPVRAVFIRAPVIEEIGPGVEVLAELNGRPVAVRQGRTLLCSFHPEIAGDGRIHQAFMEL